MAKHPNSKPNQAKQDGAMNSALKFFLAGCVAELYLLIVRRFYVNGTLEQVVAWDSYLVVLGGIGAAVLAVGALLTFLWKAQRSKRTAGLAIAGAGLFLAGSSFLIHWNMSVLTLLSAAVPVAMDRGSGHCRRRSLSGRLQLFDPLEYVCPDTFERSGSCRHGPEHPVGAL